LDYGNSFGLEQPDHEALNEIDVAFLDCDHKNQVSVKKKLEGGSGTFGTSGFFKKRDSDNNEPWTGV
jgi:hypothetical protein